MTPPVILAAAADGTSPTPEPTPEPAPEPTRTDLARANPRPNVRSNVRTVETFPPIIDSASIKQQRDRIINYSEKFYIEYTYYNNTDNKKVTKYFNFSLLPAIETTVQYSSSGNFRGNASVPEVRPGIPIRTAVKHKNIVCPGGTTVIQTVGIEGKFIALVGAFTGTEDSTDKPNSPASLDSVYPNNTKNDTVPSATSSYLKALQFDQEVVQEGREVTVYIDTVDKEQKKYPLKIKGVINEFRFQAVRRFKTYYSISMVITDFPQFGT